MRETVLLSQEEEEVEEEEEDGEKTQLQFMWSECITSLIH